MFIFKLYRLTVALVEATICAMPGFAQDRKKPSRLDGKPADQTNKLPMLILLGQSDVHKFVRVGFKETNGFLHNMIKEQGRYEFEGKVCEGHKDLVHSWVQEKEPRATPWYAGRQGEADAASANTVHKNLKNYYQDYRDLRFEVAGVVLRPGHKDQNAAHASQYDETLVRLITSLRKNRDVSHAKFVLATGCVNTGWRGLRAEDRTSPTCSQQPEKALQFPGEPERCRQA